MLTRTLRLHISGPLALFASLSLSMMPGTAHAKETLIWLLRDFPPLTIFAGPQTGQGAIDRLMPELIARMPEYNHQIMHVNRARGTQMLQDPDVFACDPTLLWTAEREKTILFSIPTYATPGNGVTIEKSNHARFAPFLTEDGHLDLATLLASKTVKVGIVAERSYGPTIDKILRATPATDSLILHYGNAAVGSMLQMERMDRFQAIISYWPEVRYHAQQQGIPLEELEFFPIKNAPKYQFAHIGCSKTDKGRAAMEVINREMRVLRTTRLIGFYAEWMVKKEEYLRDAQTFFDEAQN
ncbi:TIGR02285 family protein [Pseudomonas sp. GD03842]|uniref:TIGR02285 family protein n=1 Tax=Pseudomonas sp. GD03842 TaxID=2975385 RepID=UPI00244CF021|nr:TIGR02285 family protein [Pseudomonas sp. GD03842]MDH0748493.1 TIGR02285 family protein [Pseudomonas sp. GD03842]